MIVTCTPNPAWDVSYRVPRLRPGTTHRVGEVRGRAGGKGVNVARVLHERGFRALVTAPVGGDVGERFRTDLVASGLGYELLPVPGTTRATVAVVEDAGGEATLFTEPGEAWDGERCRALVGLVAGHLGEAAVLTCSGSVLPGSPPDCYARLVAAARRRGVPVVVDTSGTALLAAAEAGADVLTPNAAELAAACGHDDVLRGARELRDAGAGAVVVSLGAAGMLAVTGDARLVADPPWRVRGNPTGAGDAAVAALAAGIARAESWPLLLADAVTWSAAAVAAPVAGSLDTSTLAALTGTVTAREV